MSRRKSRRQRDIPQQKAKSNVDQPPREPLFPQPLIFFALAEEYGGLDSPLGTDWGQPSVPPVGTAPVLGTA
jgi:hypothetical protein